AAHATPSPTSPPDRFPPSKERPLRLPVRSFSFASRFNDPEFTLGHRAAAGVPVRDRHPQPVPARRRARELEPEILRDLVPRHDMRLLVEPQLYRLRPLRRQAPLVRQLADDQRNQRTLALELLDRHHELDLV